MKTKKILAVLLTAVLLFVFAGCGEEGDGNIVGKDFDLTEMTEFYCTYDSSTNPPEFRRYHFYRESEKYMFVYEEREGDHWPLTEEDISLFDKKEIHRTDWDVLMMCVSGGKVEKRKESTESGGRGPWYFLYWNGDKGENQVFSFDSQSSESSFNDLCEKLVDKKQYNASEVKGKTFVWEKEGFGGPFEISLFSDGTYQYSTGYLSSYIGMGDWTVEDGVLIMKGDSDFGETNVYKFRIRKDCISFIATDSSQFDGTGDNKVENGDNFNFEDVISDDYTVKSEDFYGKTYVSELSGISIKIEFKENGTYQYTIEPPLTTGSSSGSGNWDVMMGIMKLSNEDAECGETGEFRFKIEDNTLVFYGEGSNPQNFSFIVDGDVLTEEDKN